MRKLFFSCLFFLVGLAANAQTPTLSNNTISKKDVGVVNAKAILNNKVQEALNTWIEIYEMPNYQGKMARFNNTVENIILPFTSKNISIKRGSNNLARISLSTGGLNSTKNVVISDDVPNLNALNTTLENPPYSVLFLQLPYVEIFEKPNYQGKSIKFPYQVSKYYPNPAVKNYNVPVVSPPLPFVSKNVSVKLSDPKLIAYLKVNDLNPIVVHDNVPNLQLPYERINSILIDHKVHIVVSLRAILSEIHNNDCKKLYGNIDMEVYTSNGMGGQSFALIADKRNVTNPWITSSTNINPIITDQWSFNNNTTFRINAFKESKEDVQQQNKNCTMLYNIKDYYSPVNTGRPFLLLTGDYSPYDFHFIVGSMSIVNKGVYLKLKVDLGSAHKGCDLCTDFTWDAKMATADIKNIPLEKLGTPTPGGINSTYFVGNYRSDVRTNGGTNGPLHATYLQIDDGIFQNFIPHLKQL
ncbi:hypothetical protein [Ferruginibacter sp.]|nr:hypothetical protein [Ferruginibacter sp.]